MGGGGGVAANTVINKDSISLRLVSILLICLLICEEVSTPLV